ncbi:H/ACA snoRNP pseudouridylase subunit [Malassezia sp. CBS 17886]|nr:H/ACA snoRNP pseudouridylase subunit [Malassezia sp. CBS 17886]
MMNAGPPAEVAPFGAFMHAVEGEMFCAGTDPKHVPYFNAPIFLENKSQIGKVDEILGPINEVFFTVKTEPGVVATSFKEHDKVFISTDRVLPIERFLPKPKSMVKGPKKRGVDVAAGLAGVADPVGVAAGSVREVVAARRVGVVASAAVAAVALAAVAAVRHVDEAGTAAGDGDM